ncbi:MAG TPA: hypothetical protein ENI06_06345 [Spirochaetales bacterium]|nr:hypothetical protein [Spirochaetales bacterium]
MQRNIQILDTTLRDGNKLPFVVINSKERLAIAHQLSSLGVDIIDAGYPISCREDRESVEAIAREVKVPFISALSRAIKADIEDTLSLLSRAAMARAYLHVFLPLSSQFLDEVLHKSSKEALHMVADSVELGKKSGATVQFSLGEIGETETALLVEAAQAAARAGADVLSLADTNGTLTPHEVSDLITFLNSELKKWPKMLLGVHFHNDLGLATANTLTAIECGVRHVECTIGGIGARGGNTPFEEVVFGIEMLSRRLEISHSIDLKQIHEVSRLVNHITGVQPHPNKAIIGKCAFVEPTASRSQNSLPEWKRSIFSAETIGRSPDASFGYQEMSLSGFKNQLESQGIALAGIDLEKAYHLFQSQTRRKKEVTRKEILLMLADARLEVSVPYSLISFNVMTGSNTRPVGVVEIKRDKAKLVEAASGNGAIDALCRAVDRAVGISPRLVLYSVDSLTEGKDARAEVTITLSYLGKSFHGHCGSTDVVEASLRAYLDAVNRLILSGITESAEEFYIDGEHLWE